jgi:hypothetical protein
VNFAFGTILLVILLIPPLIFIYSFGKGTHAKRIPKMSLAEYLFLSAVLSLFLHSAAIHLLKLNVDYRFLVQFIAGQFSPEDLEQYKPKLGRYFTSFAEYTLGLCIFCICCGILLQYAITWRKLRMLKWLQKFRRNRKPNDMYCYFNRWWYVFRANEYDSAYAYLKNREPLVFIDVLVDTKDGSVIYSGVLCDFAIKENDLDTLYLGNSTKRLFSQQEGTQKRNLKDGDEVSITPGGLLCLPYKQILNLHIRFVSPLAKNEDLEQKANEDELAELLRTGMPEDVTLPTRPTASKKLAKGDND